MHTKARILAFVVGLTFLKNVLHSLISATDDVCHFGGFRSILFSSQISITLLSEVLIVCLPSVYSGVAFSFLTFLIT